MLGIYVLATAAIAIAAPTVEVGPPVSKRMNPSCYTPYMDDFEDLPAVPAVPATDIGIYKGLDFKSLYAIGAPTAKVFSIAPPPSSGDNYIGVGVRGQITTGQPMLSTMYDGSTTQSFTMEEFSFGFALDLETGVLSVPFFGTLIIEGYRGSTLQDKKKACTQVFEYKLSSLPAKLQSTGLISPDCADINFLTFTYASTGLASPLSGLMALLVDDMRYNTTSSCSPTTILKRTDPVCSSPSPEKTATFDDLEVPPATDVLPVPDGYQDLTWTAFSQDNALTPVFGVPGVRPASGQNYASSGLRGEVTSGTAMIQPSDSNTKLTLKSFSYAIITNGVVENAATVPLIGDVTIVGYRGLPDSIQHSEQICSYTFTYEGNSPNAHMASTGNLIPESCKDLDYVQFLYSTNGILKPVSGFVALLIDSLVFTLTECPSVSRRSSSVCSGPSSTETITFDDKFVLPGTAIQMVPDGYKGLNWPAFGFVNAIAQKLGLPSVKPESGTNYIATGFKGEFLDGKALIQTADSKTRLTLKGFSYGLALDTVVEAAASLPQSAVLVITGYVGSPNNKDGSMQRCSQTFPFKPSGINSEMASTGDVDPKCSNLDYVTFTYSTTGAEKVLSGLVALLIDSIVVTFTNCE